MFYVYLLQSKINGDIYVGSTSDLRNRVSEHNAGQVKSTKSYKPWILIYYEAYQSKTDMRKRELQLKEHKPKSDLLKQIGYSLIEAKE